MCVATYTYACTYTLCIIQNVTDNKDTLPTPTTLCDTKYIYTGTGSELGAQSAGNPEN